MLCSCIYEISDNIESKIRSIFGHISTCKNFKVDKDQFEKNLSSLVNKEIYKINLKSLSNAIEVEERVSSSKITKKLYGYLSKKYIPIVPNIYIFDWESDLLAISKKNSYTTEYEIKISRSDFKNDFKKFDKHQHLSDSYQYKCNFNSVPNYLYYVTPPGLLDKKELPVYSGLIEVGVGVRVVKRAPKFHDKVLNLENQLFQKAYWKYWNTR